jgi:formamidopyrimidine-DNA glycosylase
MDQTVIAGLGTLYTDEILFQAGLHPRTPVQSLDDAARRSLFDAMQSVLTTAIDCQADPEQLPDDRFLLPHRDGDGLDPYSGTPLRKVTVAGRTGYYSPARQPSP